MKVGNVCWIPTKEFLRISRVYEKLIVQSHLQGIFFLNNGGFLSHLGQASQRLQVEKVPNGEGHRWSPPPHLGYHTSSCTPGLKDIQTPLEEVLTKRYQLSASSHQNWIRINTESWPKWSAHTYNSGQLQYFIIFRWPTRSGHLRWWLPFRTIPNHFFQFSVTVMSLYKKPRRWSQHSHGMSSDQETMEQKRQRCQASTPQAPASAHGTLTWRLLRSGMPIRLSNW